MACHPSLIIALASVGLVLGADAFAKDRNSLPESVSRVERETGGRVLSAERRHQGGREVNRIKVYTPEGRVRVMWDEPRRDAPATQGAPQQRREPAADARRPVPPRQRQGDDRR